MKKISYLLLAVMVITLFCSCQSSSETAISGTEFDPKEYETEMIERYENRLYGIILEYPGKFQRLGNFELDGYISFEKGETAVLVYVPDAEHNDIFTAEEYTKNILKLPVEKGSGNVKYGKSSGFKSISHIEDKIRIDFTIKGVDAFYRFAYVTKAEGFSEEDETFQQIISSIRIDDGVYNKLTSMAARYELLFEYAKSMEYINQAHYINHCLNNYETTKKERHIQEAISAAEGIRLEMYDIVNYQRTKNEGFDSEWNNIVSEAQEIVDSCLKLEELLKSGQYSEAQTLARKGFNYDLSKSTENFLTMIHVELSEY